MNSLTKWAKGKKKEISSTGTVKRDEYLTMIEDGTLWVEFLKDLAQAKNERGEPFKLEPWRKDYSRLLIDMRIPLKVVSGAAQTGKSIQVIMVYAWLVSRCGFNAMFLFPQQQALQRIVPINHNPIFQEFERINHPKARKSDRTDNLRTKASASGGNTMYASPTQKAESNDTAAASTSVVSVSVDLLVVDEISQYVGGSVDTATRRLDAGRIPSKPVIYCGTPGSGSGAERYIKQCQYQFYPGLYCPHCSKPTLLHPFGGLFKKVKQTLPTGEVTDVFLSTNGRPLKWLSEDEKDPIYTAYLSCEFCDRKISQEHLDHPTKGIEFFDKGSRLSLKDLFEKDEVPHSVSVELSPLVRGYKSLPRLIQQGLQTANSADWVQQALGCQSDFSASIISEDQIRAAIGHPTPHVRENEYAVGCDMVTVVGIDQGRGNDYLVIMKVYYDPDAKTEREAFDSAVREIVYCSAIARNEIPTIISNYSKGTDVIGFIDNEPNISEAAVLCEEVDGLMMVDQQARQKDSFIDKVVRDGGIEFPCIKLAYSKFMRGLITGFSYKAFDELPRFRFPQELGDRIMLDITETSPKKHITSVSFDPETGKILRPTDHNDDLMFGLMFAESAFAYFLEKGQYETTNNSWDWMSEM